MVLHEASLGIVAVDGSGLRGQSCSLNMMAFVGHCHGVGEGVEPTQELWLRGLPPCIIHVKEHYMKMKCITYAKSQ